MKKTDLAVGMLVVLADGTTRLVAETCNDGLVLISAENKVLVVDKYDDDMFVSRYSKNGGKAIVAAFGLMQDASGSLFETGDRCVVWQQEIDSRPRMTKAEVEAAYGIVITDDTDEDDWDDDDEM